MMEIRTIDADALVAKLDDWRGDIEDVDKNDAHGVAYYSAMSRAIRFAKDAPTLDPTPKWISVKDRLPEEEKEVLCYLGNALGKGIVVAFRRHGDWYFDGWKCPTVTHWMPLPEPPKEES